MPVTPFAGLGVLVTSIWYARLSVTRHRTKEKNPNMAMIGIAGKCARAMIVAASALALGSAFAVSAAASAAPQHPQKAQKAQKRSLTNVACTSTHHCIAIGRIGTAAFPPSLAEAWNGSHWRRIASPGVEGPVGLDCLGSSFCLVGGADFGKGQSDSSVWNGKRWKVTHNVDAPGFNQISCVTRKSCVTVGFGGALVSWNGAKWQFFKNVPEPKDVNDFQLTGVSCTTVKFCLAVGFFTTLDQDTTTQTVAEMWDGTAWHLLSSPSGNVDSTFNAVSCVSPAHCMVVGSITTRRSSADAVTAASIAALWDGKTFHVTHLPGPLGNPFGPDLGNRGLQAISCPTASRCMAVGNFGARRTKPLGGIAVAWNGTKWQLTKLRGKVGGLNDVSCPAADDCITVGGSGNHNMSQRWNGKSWTLLTTP